MCYFYRNGLPQVRTSNGDHRNTNYNGLGGFSHEHTDSGLGAEQDFEDRYRIYFFIILRFEHLW